MIKLSSDAAFALADSFSRSIDDESGGSAKVILYEGNRPLNVDTPLSGQKEVIEFDLPSQPFVLREVTETYVAFELSTSPQTFSMVAGDVAFFRLFNNLGEAVMDGDVTIPSGNGDMKISLTQVTPGYLVKILSFVYKIAKAP